MWETINSKELFPGRDIAAEWDARPNKNALPALTELSHIKINLPALKELFANRSLARITAYEKNYIETLKDVDAGYSSRYYEGILTHPSAQAIALQKKLDQRRGQPWYEHSANLSRKQVLKSLKHLNEDYDPLVDERNYTQLAPGLENSYFSELLALFKGRVTRARFGKLAPGEGIRPHKDVIPQYACRLHIPIYTNPFAFSFSWERGKLSSFHMQAGRVYLLNGGKTHWAHNFGSTDRIHLVMSVDGVEDYAN